MNAASCQLLGPTAGNLTLASPVVMGTAIRRDTEGRVSLNDLHAASGRNPNKRPASYLRTGPAKEFVRELTDAHICASPLQTGKGGASQGTYAHEQVALEYARWISPAFAIQVNQVFFDFHRGLLRPALPSLPDTLRLAADLAEQNANQAKQLDELRPKAMAFDRLAQGADDAVTLTEAAKVLQKPQHQVLEWLHHHRWIYRREGKNCRWLAYEDKRRQGVLIHRITTVDAGNGERLDVAQVLVTRKGLARIAEQMGCGA